MFNAYSYITDTHAGHVIRMENLFKRARKIQFSFFESNRTEPIERFSEKKKRCAFCSNILKSKGTPEMDF